jgi:hypothetical protein
MVQQPPHFSATVRQSEESALMVRLLPATAEESRGSDLEDTLRKTTRPGLCICRHFGRTDLTMKAATPDIVCMRPEIVEKHCGERRCTKAGGWPHHGDVIRTDTKKKL